MISITETAVRMRVIDPMSRCDDPFEPMIGDAASMSEGTNII